MRIVVQTAGGDREVDVALRNPEATLGELLHAVLGTEVPASVAIDERVVPAWWRVVDSGLHEGATLAPVPDDAPHRQLAAAAARARGLSGVDAGRVLPAARGPARRWAATRATRSCSRTLRSRAPLRARARRGRVRHAHRPRLGQRHARRRHEPTLAIAPGQRDRARRARRRGPRPDATTTARTASTCAGIWARAARSRSTGRRARRRLPRRRELEPPEEPSERAKPHFSVASTLGPLVLAGRHGGGHRRSAVRAVRAADPVHRDRHLRRVAAPRSRKERASDQRQYEAELDELERADRRGGALERTRLRDGCPDPGRGAAPRGAAERPAVGAAARARRLPAPVRGARRRRPSRRPSTTARTARRAGDRGARGRRLLAAPVDVDLSDGGVVGIVGDRDAALATARSLLCQAAVHHGPADLTIGVFVDPGREPEWDWCKWLPHTRRRRRRAASGSAPARAQRRAAARAGRGRRHRDRARGARLRRADRRARNAPARDLLNAARARPRRRRRPPVPVAGIVIAATADRLPAACNTVIEIASPDGDATVRRPRGHGSRSVLLAGLAAGPRTALRARPRALRGPRAAQAGAGLPDSVRLLPLLELERVDAESIQDALAARRAGPAVAPLGVTEQRRLHARPRVRDGPHGLVGGTTGSGKSELLRSLVAALAAQRRPDASSTFVLMDFKGGAAFDECARLPHTVGMVTDLDEQLGERALRALEAELQHRERLLRSVGADNLRDVPRSSSTDEPLPRLVVVIDEFATMASELPDFLSALVGRRAARPHARRAPDPRDAAPVGRGQRQHPDEHEPADRAARAGRGRLDRRDRRSATPRELSRPPPGRAYVRLGPERGRPDPDARSSPA